LTFSGKQNDSQANTPCLPLSPPRKSQEQKSIQQNFKP
jgi:hypothetical protein